MDDKTVLDLACGNGRWLRRFAPGVYIGLDLNAKMLDEARREFPDHTFIQADMTRLPFEDCSFDGIVSLFGAMGHLPRQGHHEMFGEAYRVLKSSGVAIFTNGNMLSPFNLPTTVKGSRVRIEGVRLRVHSFTPKQFREVVSEAGFELLDISSYDYSYLPIMPLKFGELPSYSNAALVRETACCCVQETMCLDSLLSNLLVVQTEQSFAIVSRSR
jgi:ubiquinone/menaquinone biosynthesis C-methylase UbiE